MYFTYVYLYIYIYIYMLLYAIWADLAWDSAGPFFASTGFEAMDVTKPCDFIGFGAMYVTKPYDFIGFGAIPNPMNL
jgi:hypothetical protein